MTSKGKKKKFKRAHESDEEHEPDVLKAPRTSGPRERSAGTVNVALQRERRQGEDRAYSRDGRLRQSAIDELSSAVPMEDEEDEHSTDLNPTASTSSFLYQGAPLPAVTRVMAPGAAGQPNVTSDLSTTFGSPALFSSSTLPIPPFGTASPVPLNDHLDPNPFSSPTSSLTNAGPSFSFTAPSIPPTPTFSSTIYPLQAPGTSTSAMTMSPATGGVMNGWNPEATGSGSGDQQFNAAPMGMEMNVEDEQLPEQSFSGTISSGRLPVQMNARSASSNQPLFKDGQTTSTRGTVTPALSAFIRSLLVSLDLPVDPLLQRIKYLFESYARNHSLGKKKDPEWGELEDLPAEDEPGAKNGGRPNLTKRVLSVLVYVVALERGSERGVPLGDIGAQTDTETGTLQQVLSNVLSSLSITLPAVSPVIFIPRLMTAWLSSESPQDQLDIIHSLATFIVRFVTSRKLMEHRAPEPVAIGALSVAYESYLTMKSAHSTVKTNTPMPAEHKTGVKHTQRHVNLMAKVCGVADFTCLERYRETIKAFYLELTRPDTPSSLQIKLAPGSKKDLNGKNKRPLRKAGTGTAAAAALQSPAPAAETDETPLEEDVEAETSTKKDKVAKTGFAVTGPNKKEVLRILPNFKEYYNRTFPSAFLSPDPSSSPAPRQGAIAAQLPVASTSAVPDSGDAGTSLLDPSLRSATAGNEMTEQELADTFDSRYLNTVIDHQLFMDTYLPPRQFKGAGTGYVSGRPEGTSRVRPYELKKKREGEAAWKALSNAYAPTNHPASKSQIVLKRKDDEEDAGLLDPAITHELLLGTIGEGGGSVDLAKELGFDDDGDPDHRLARLKWEKAEWEITDEELFHDQEWDDILRTQESERVDLEQLKIRLGHWTVDNLNAAGAGSGKGKGKGKGKKVPRKRGAPGSSEDDLDLDDTMDILASGGAGIDDPQVRTFLESIPAARRTGKSKVAAQLPVASTSAVPDSGDAGTSLLDPSLSTATSLPLTELFYPPTPMPPSTSGANCPLLPLQAPGASTSATPKKPKKTVRRWTTAEVDKLKESVEACRNPNGTVSWKDVSDKMGTRSHQQCSTKWHSLNSAKGAKITEATVASTSELKRKEEGAGEGAGTATMKGKGKKKETGHAEGEGEGGVLPNDWAVIIANAQAAQASRDPYELPPPTRFDSSASYALAVDASTHQPQPFSDHSSDYIFDSNDATFSDFMSKAANWTAGSGNTLSASTGTTASGPASTSSSSPPLPPPPTTTPAYLAQFNEWCIRCLTESTDNEGVDINVIVDEFEEELGLETTTVDPELLRPAIVAAVPRARLETISDAAGNFVVVYGATTPSIMMMTR